MKSVSRSAIYTLLTQIPSQIFGVIAGIFITRMLGPEGRGVYALFFADITLLSVVFGFSLGTSITFYVSNQRIRKDKIMGLTILFSLVTVILSLLLLLIWLNLPFSDLLIPDENVTIPFIIVFCLFVVVNQIDLVYASFFQGEQKFGIVNRVLLVNSGISLLFYGVLFLLHSANWVVVDIYTILYLSLAIISINVLHWRYQFRKHLVYEINFKFSWKEDIKPFLHFMGLDHFANILTFFNGRLVLWIIAFYYSDGSVGIFAVALGITQLLSMLSNPLSQVLFPVIWAVDAKKHLKVYTLFSRAHFSVLLVCAIVGIVLAGVAIPLVYGEDFNGSVVPLQLMFIPAILACQTKIFTGVLFAENKVKFYFFSALVGFGLTLILNFLFVPKYGVVGAAWATSISFIATFIITYLSMLLFVDLPTRNLFFLTRKDLKEVIFKLTSKIRSLKS